MGRMMKIMTMRMRDIRNLGLCWELRNSWMLLKTLGNIGKIDNIGNKEKIMELDIRK